MFLDDGMFHSTSTRLESLLYGMWIIPFLPPPQPSSYFIYPHWTDEIIVQTAPISLFSEILDGWISHTPITNTNQQKWRKEKKKKNRIIYYLLRSLTWAAWLWQSEGTQMWLCKCFRAAERLDTGPGANHWSGDRANAPGSESTERERRDGGGWRL